MDHAAGGGTLPAGGKRVCDGRRDKIHKTRECEDLVRSLRGLAYPKLFFSESDGLIGVDGVEAGLGREELIYMFDRYLL